MPRTNTGKEVIKDIYFHSHGIKKNTITCNGILILIFLPFERQILVVSKEKCTTLTKIGN